MESPIEEIETSLATGNFSRSLQIADEWLKSFSIEEKEAAEYGRAQEAFLYSRFFLHRQERMASLPVGGDKARTFLKFLTELAEVRDENEISGESSFWQSVQYFIHTQIAEGLARDFAGQKSYNLDSDEVMLLATSLVEIENWKAAEEALQFAHHLNSKNALANLLLAHVYYRLQDEKKMAIHLREALFLKPELLVGYLRFLPGGPFHKLWDHLEEAEMEPAMRCRTFALALEINGIYAHKRKMKADEFKKLEHDFARMYKDFQSSSASQSEETKPRILHFLCWIVDYAQRLRMFDKVEEYRTLMIDIDAETWRTFQDKSLAPN